MLPYVSPNSCIAASKITYDCLRLLGFDPQPLPTKLAVTVPSLELVFCAGVSAEERATAKGQRRAFEGGWEGHLVVRAGDWLLDPSLDQAAVALERIELRREVFLFPLQGATDHFHVTYQAVLEDGHQVKIEYVTTNDESYRATDAWNDEGLPLLEWQILAAM